MSEIRDVDGNDPEAGGRIAGVTSASVTNNADPDGLGRVKVKFYWRDDAQESDWARIATPMAGAGCGLFLLPDVGDEVLVAFERNDIRFPYVIGSLWSRPAKPPETNADGKNAMRLIQTPKGHGLLFDDSDNSRIQIKLADGKSVVIDSDGIVIDDQANTITLDGKAGRVTIEAKQELILKAATISIDAASKMEIRGGQMLEAQATLVKIN